MMLSAIIICGSLMDSVATRTFVQQFSHPLRNHTKVMLLDAANKMFTDVALCTRLWPPSSPIINATIPLSTLSGFNMLTILSTNFAKYLKLVINQGPIRSSNSTQTASSSSSSSRRLAQFENQIKSSVDEPGMELMPEIMSKIKHFYSTTSSENASYTNMDNVLEYCKQFLANNFRFDTNTTEYVCTNLLLNDDHHQPNDEVEEEESDVVDVVVVSELDGAMKPSKTTSLVRSRCPLVVEWYALFDFIISTATIVSSSGKPTNHRVEMTVLGNGGGGVGGGGDGASVDDDVDDGDINGAAVEYNLLEYDIVAEGFAWPPVLRLKPFTSKRNVRRKGSSGKHDGNEIVSRGSSSSLGRVYADWMSGGLNMFWQCGAHCWTVTLLISLMFLMSVFGSIVAVIAIR